ncbi:hypothetical protein TPR58_05695 [Sphingomonas sp. HF-S3]|uniref:Uncharacterized protein n=1 Tax=Sphingomonas rustica TaxID=3103142 RepID=A0ABV0B8B6_9SPHN
MIWANLIGRLAGWTVPVAFTIFPIAVGGGASMTQAGVPTEPVAIAADTPALAISARAEGERGETRYRAAAVANMMFIPQSNGSVQTIPVNLGPSAPASVGRRSPNSFSGDLYMAAEAERGDRRVMHVPQPNGTVSSVPINAGALIHSLREGGAALALLADLPATAPPSSDRLGSGGPESIFDGVIGSVFQTIVKIEVFSDKCLVRGKEYGEPHNLYAEKAWKCLLESRLPDNCASFPDAILRSVRFVRFNPNFVALHQLMPRVVRQCLGGYQGSVESAYEKVEYAGVFDLVLDDLGHSTRRQSQLV